MSLRALAIIAFTTSLQLLAPAVRADSCPQGSSQLVERWAGQGQWRAIEAAGYHFGKLDIRVLDVYDTPLEEQRWYEKTANFLHLDTHEAAVRAALTIAPGEPVSAIRVYQAERNLRNLRYLLDADITPVACNNGEVHARVTVHDAWSLTLSVSAGSVGGVNSHGFEIEDYNFLGSGKTLKLAQASDPERDTVEFTYRDPNVLGGPWRLDATHGSLSDGNSNSLVLDYPFRTFYQPWSFDIIGSDVTSTLYFYDRAETAWVTSSTAEIQDYRVRRLLNFSGDSGWRLGGGWRYENHDYDRLLEITPGILPPPELPDRQLSGPYVLLERFHEHYAGFRNIQAMDRHEDFNLGLNFSLLLGNFATDTGSSEDALYMGSEATWGATVGGSGLVLVDSRYSARKLDGDIIGGSGHFAATMYRPIQDQSTWVTRVQLDWLDDPDPDQQLYIGGIDGLFGYPEHLRTGDRSWQAHLEYRRVTNQVLFKTLRVGYSAFLQAARIHERDDRWSDTYSNVGIGFRLGNLRGSFAHTIYIGVAVPLVHDAQSEDWQILVTDKITF